MERTGQSASYNDGSFLFFVAGIKENANKAVQPLLLL
jgi:hypothetical protein